MKGILFLIAIFLVSCSNDKSKHTANEPATPPAVTQKADTVSKQNVDSSLVIHPMESMDKVVRDINGHINNIVNSKKIDADFIKIMKVYNQAFMEMAYMETTKGQNATLKRWATEIVADKRAENITLSKMEEKLTSTKLHDDSFYEDINRFLQDSLFLPSTSTLPVDKQFAILLPPHHQRAIDVGRLYLKHSTNAELKAFTQKWIKEYEHNMVRIKPIDEAIKL